MIKLLITGDFCPIGRTEQIIKAENYHLLFNGFEKLRREVDYALVNLECPITNSKDAISKTGPCIKSSNKNAFKALKYAGFDMVTLANNHIQDYGSEGVNDTINEAINFGFDYVGAGANRANAVLPRIIRIKDKKIGFINLAENEFCAATEDEAGANTFDSVDTIKQILELKKNVDQLIVIYHGGREHYQLPTPEQRKRLRFFIDCGADAIIAHHTHCFSGYEYYNNKPIVYSLGNFIFDYKKKYQKGLWTEGMSVILTFEDKISLEFIPHYQGKESNPNLELLTGESKNLFLEKVENLSKIIQNDMLFNNEWKNYIETQKGFYLSSLYIKNIYVRALFMKGILPSSWLKNHHNKLLLNLSRCETHREITIDVLKSGK